MRSALQRLCPRVGFEGSHGGEDHQQRVVKLTLGVRPTRCVTRSPELRPPRWSKGGYYLSRPSERERAMVRKGGLDPMVLQPVKLETTSELT